MASVHSLRDQSHEQITRSILETEQYWNSLTIEMPITKELKALIRMDLMEDWHFQRQYERRQVARREWGPVDYGRIILEDKVGEVDHRKLKLLCNKPTAFYWLQSAQLDNAYGERRRTPLIMLATIYEEWLRHYSYKPNIEFGHFFANTVRITSTGPSSVDEVIGAHLSLYTQASSLLSPGANGTSILSPHCYSLHPLYQAIIVIADNCEGPQYDPDHRVSLRKHAQRQTVLIARTGREEGLSAPISFDSIRSECLPLGLSDIKDLDIVRVSLATAVHYICSLEEREERFDKHVVLDIRLCDQIALQFEGDPNAHHDPHTYADATIATAEKHGFENFQATRSSLRRVLARKVGEKFAPFELEPMLSVLKSE